MSETKAALTLSQAKQERLKAVAHRLIDARRGQPIVELPAELRPTTLEESYFIQDCMAQAMGPVCAWKMGGAPGTAPLFGPILQSGFTLNGAAFANPYQRLRGVEAEIGFLIGQDLPPRATPYTREAVVAAIASCHPAIEELEAAFTKLEGLDRLSMIADLLGNGGLAVGPAFAGWKEFDFANESVRLIVDGTVRVEAKASNPGGTDLVRFPVWLANEGASRTGGLKKGQWIITGTWTGMVFVNAGSSVTGEFRHAGAANLRFL